jgi:hypothetical protein
MTLKKYLNVGTSPIVFNKRLTLPPGETTEEFVALDPAKEAYLISIGAVKVTEEKKRSVVDPEIVFGEGAVVEDTSGVPAVSADLPPGQQFAMTESEIKEVEKANKKTTKKSR